ncbi:MAG: protein sorting system archaetidylserine decarboxylase [Halodesulfurarchaeum sp.]|nr:protein sorting system archaetidylserine decarboxylase [Halodesulfurarchaeum sp.]
MQLAPGTWRLAGPVVAVGAVGLILSPLVGLVLILLGLGIIWFHRDPERSSPDAGVLAPADGTVTVLRTEQEATGAERIRLGVFMNITDVHVNRAPVGGEITTIEHVPGGHWPAFTKDAERNERAHIDIDQFRVTLTAGTVARRIHPHVSEESNIERGERIGHVSFGSRADVLLPERFELSDIEVAMGATVRAGESVLAVDPD